MNVQPGEIEVTRVDQVLDTEQAKAWDVTMGSKHVQAFHTQDAVQVRVHLYADEHTAFTSEKLKGIDTVVSVEVPEDWVVLADCARYTCRIVAYQPNYDHQGEGDRRLLE